MSKPLAPHSCIGVYKGTYVLLEHQHMFMSMTNNIEEHLYFYKVDKIVYFSSSDSTWTLAKRMLHGIEFSFPSETEIEELNTMAGFLDFVKKIQERHNRNQ